MEMEIRSLMSDRQRTGNESALPIRAVAAALRTNPAIYDKLHRIARLQALLSALQLAAARHRLAVHRYDHVARLQTDVIRERPRLHADHLYALLLQIHVGVHLLGQVLDPHAEAHGSAAVFDRMARLAAAAEAFGEYLRQITDYDFHIALLAVTQNAQIQRIAYLRRVQHIHQLVAVMDRLAVDRDNHIARLDARLFAGTAWLYAVDEDAILRTGDPQIRPCLIEIAPLEGDADRTARHLAALDDLVINGRRCVDRQREAHALETTGA